MRVKSLADLGHVNTGTPQAKQLRAAFAAYERDATQSRRPVGAEATTTLPSRTSGKTRDPQQILTAMVKADSELGDLGWEEDFVGAIPGRKYEIDLALCDTRLGVEVDGWQYHGKHKESFLRDRDKDYLLTLHGWVIIRVQAGLITSDPEESLNRIRRFISVWMPRQRVILSGF